MDFNSSTYNRYRDSKTSLYPKKSLLREMKRFKWEIIIPLGVIIMVILWVICMQVPSGLA